VDIFYDNGRCSVVIYEVYLEDAGEYICVGKNEHGSTQTSCRLIVERMITHLIVFRQTRLVHIILHYYYHYYVPIDEMLSMQIINIP